MCNKKCSTCFYNSQGCNPQCFIDSSVLRDIISPTEEVCDRWEDDKGLSYNFTSIFKEDGYIYDSISE